MNHSTTAVLQKRWKPKSFPNLNHSEGVIFCTSCLWTLPNPQKQPGCACLNMNDCTFLHNESFWADFSNEGQTRRSASSSIVTAFFLKCWQLPAAGNEESFRPRMTRCAVGAGQYGDANRFRTKLLNFSVHFCVFLEIWTKTTVHKTGVTNVFSILKRLRFKFVSTSSKSFFYSVSRKKII